MIETTQKGNVNVGYNSIVEKDGKHVCLHRMVRGEMLSFSESNEEM